MIRVVLLLLPIVCSAGPSLKEPIGLVLGGGGAKGAYQVGVWETLVEAGLAPRVRVFSGTSVGAINAALFATCSDTGRMERIWLESLPKVLARNERRINSFVESVATSTDEAYRCDLEKELQRRSALTGVPVSDFPREWLDAIENEIAKRHKGTPFRVLAGQIVDEAANIVATTNVTEGIMANDQLRSVIRDNLPAKWPQNAATVYATALRKGLSSSTTKWESVAWLLNSDPSYLRYEKILASAAIPGVFTSVVIDGVAYVDGGWEDMGGDNSPIQPIVKDHPEIKTVFVVYLNEDRHIVGRIRKEEYPNLTLVEIFPSHNIGQWMTGSLNFDVDKAKRLLALGRADARKALQRYFCQIPNRNPHN